MKVFVAVALALCLVHVASASMPVLSGKSSLRFGEISSENIADNSISTSKLQAYAVGAQQLAGGAVDSNKIASEAIYAPHFSPNSVTSRSLAVDTVIIHIDGQDPVESTQMGGATIPVGPNSVQPFEGALGGTAVQIDLPNTGNGYVVEGKARGPGVILGWYPARNGHLLRYQHARSLRGLVCADVGIEDMDNNFNCGCTCACNSGDFDVDFFNGNDNDCSCTCSCSVDDDFRNMNWDRDLGLDGTDLNCDVICTSLEDGYPGVGATCLDPNGNLLTDPACPGSTLPNALDVGDGEVDFNVFGGFDVNKVQQTDILEQPEACSSYTSVEDVFNPQEGVPNYSPSVESITIDDEGRIFLRFLGYGGVDRLNTATHPDIDIVVVVLLDEQFGA